MLKFDAHLAIRPEEFEAYRPEVARIHQMIIEKTGAGADYLGWHAWAKNYDRDEFERIKKAAAQIREQANVLVVCGIGGSYLGARAAIDMIRGPYAQDKLEIIYMGNTFSSTAIVRTLKYLEDKEVAVNVISKSGTTTETSLAFRLLRQFLEEKYGPEEAAQRIYATTDKAKGLLKPLADRYGYETFVIPDDIGGRFSVITPVGLLPIAAAGIDIDALMAGVAKATEDFNRPELLENPAYQYGVARRILEKKGKVAEMFVSYDPQLLYIGEWWKQLFGESEGKEDKGVLPHAVNFTTDLHSMGQFIQEGTKVLFETNLVLAEPMDDLIFPDDADDADQMNYLSGRSLDWVNKQAFAGTLEAHVETGKVPNLVIELGKADATHFGYLVYFFFQALAMSVYLLGVNPFDQPGVEVYKRNMFRLLGKPGAK